VARSVPSWPRLCQNSKLPGFRVSLYPSRRAAKPIQSVLIGRLSRSMSKSHVLTQPRLASVAYDRHTRLSLPSRARRPRPEWTQSGLLVCYQPPRVFVAKAHCVWILIPSVHHWQGCNNGRDAFWKLHKANGFPTMWHLTKWRGKLLRYTKNLAVCSGD